MAKPLKPGEVEAHKTAKLPSAVIDVFNDLISDAWDGSEAIVTQDKAAKAVAKKMNISTSEVFERGLLDVETTYRRIGWHVEYDKPGFNESYGAFFRFTRKKR